MTLKVLVICVLLCRDLLHFLLKWGCRPVYIIENTPKLLWVCERYNQADSLVDLLALQIPK